MRQTCLLLFFTAILAVRATAACGGAVDPGDGGGGALATGGGHSTQGGASAAGGGGEGGEGGGGGGAPCTAAPPALLLADNALSAVVVSPSGAWTAAVRATSWAASAGQLVVLDAAGSITVVAEDVTPPVRWIGASDRLAYDAGITQVYGDGWATRNVAVFDPTTGQNGIVATDVITFATSSDGQNMAFQAPEDTLVVDVSTGAATSLGTGKPCTFEAESGFECLPLRFTEKGDLVFPGEATTTGSSLFFATMPDTAADLVATDVYEFKVSGDGRAIAIASNRVFDATCSCPRGDLSIVDHQTGAVRVLHSGAAYASVSQHVALPESGTRYAHVDPEKDPTTVTLGDLESPDPLWIEPEAMLAPPIFFGTHVLVRKLEWSGSSLDTLVEAISADEAGTHTEIATRLDRLGLQRDPLILAALENTPDPQIPARDLRVWQIKDGAMVETGLLPLPSAPIALDDRFDQTGTFISLTLDSADNLHGRAIVGAPTEGVFYELSAKNAFAARWLGGGPWIAFLEQPLGGAPSPLFIARAPGFEPGPVGHEGSVFDAHPASCGAALWFADCAAAPPLAAACEGQTGGVYRVVLP